MKHSHFSSLAEGDFLHDGWQSSMFGAELGFRGSTRVAMPAKVDNGVTCDDCMALVVTAPYGNRCDKYCESFDHVCVAAAEEQNENCAIQYTKRCDEPIEGTSDMLCKCVKKNAPPFCPAPPAPPAPTPEPTPSPDARIQVVGAEAEIANMS